MSADRPGVPPALVLAVAVAAVSTAAPLVRLAPDVHPLAAGFWRVALVAGILAPGLRGRMPRLRYVLPTAVAGLLLALHFWAWFASLQHTTVLRSTLLVCLNPVWAALAERFLLGRAPGSRYWLGLALSLGGVGLMATSGTGLSAVGPSLWGDGLALLGGLLGSAYMLVGRLVRQRVDIGPYGALVCASAAGWLALFALGADAALLGFSHRSWAALAAMALGPQLLGHIGVNYALRWISAGTVAALLLIEPVGAAAIGAAVLGEVPAPRELAGAALVLGGLAVSVLRRPAPAA